MDNSVAHIAIASILLGLEYERTAIADRESEVIAQLVDCLSLTVM